MEMPPMSLTSLNRKSVGTREKPYPGFIILKMDRRARTFCEARDYP